MDDPAAAFASARPSSSTFVRGKLSRRHNEAVIVGYAAPSAVVERDIV
ncbi:hypothetical protein HMPREF0591_2251 [Mycobacterium parascrofulaceum ATCC BAA-614]|uniref:Uncharacterized protein n=1 Tax=Mycobacterium parascrofulaceum ATCC BAA-614 TaxID=525368 RepID=D5P7V7_9MYCO|nr:hypothetical protein HMPREF0591_2251 [Mycobacterium parascrofulaceum ATCC BAA-614]